MKPVCTLFLAILLSALPATTALAQYEGSDSRYAREQADERATMRKWKLILGGGVLVIAGVVVGVQKLRGKK